jgi:hypothetical protein
MARTNIVIIRVVGICFILGGVALSIQFVALLLRPAATLGWFGEQTADVGPKSIAAAASLFVLIAGIFLERSARNQLRDARHKK